MGENPEVTRGLDASLKIVTKNNQKDHTVRTVVVAGFLGLFCCGAPALLVTAGFGAAIAAKFHEVRPVVLVLLVSLLAVALYWVARRGRSPRGCDCSDN